MISIYLFIIIEKKGRIVKRQNAGNSTKENFFPGMKIGKVHADDFPEDPPFLLQMRKRRFLLHEKFGNFLYRRKNGDTPIIREGDHLTRNAPRHKRK